MSSEDIKYLQSQIEELREKIRILESNELNEEKSLLVKHRNVSQNVDIFTQIHDFKEFSSYMKKKYNFIVDGDREIINYSNGDYGTYYYHYDFGYAININTKDFKSNPILLARILKENQIYSDL